GQLPAAWSMDTLGEAGGTVKYDSGAFELRAASGDGAYWFVHRTLVGDGEFTVRLASIQAPKATARAGLMIRDSLRADAPSVFVAIDLAGAVSIVRRERPGANVETLPQGNLAIPCYLKLVRQGRRVSFQKSDDGRNFVPLGPGVSAE